MSEVISLQDYKDKNRIAWLNTITFDIDVRPVYYNYEVCYLYRNLTTGEECSTSFKTRLRGAIECTDWYKVLLDEIDINVKSMSNNLMTMEDVIVHSIVFLYQE